MAYGDNYGENYGSATTPEQPEEPEMTTAAQLNDELVIEFNTIMQGTKQGTAPNLYVHVHTDNTVSLVQQEDGLEVESIFITTEGIELLRRVLATLPDTEVHTPAGLEVATPV